MSLVLLLRQPRNPAQMCVGIDKARDEKATLAVDLLPALQRPRAELGDAPVFEPHVGMFEGSRSLR